MMFFIVSGICVSPICVKISKGEDKVRKEELEEYNMVVEADAVW